MPDQGETELRVGLITGQERQERYLRELLEANGLNVVTGFQTGAIDIEAVRASPADALVILINGEAEQAIDELELLIEEVEVPLLFHEGAVPRDPGWGGKLRAKLERLVRREPRQVSAEPVLKPVAGDAGTMAAATPAPLQIVASQEQRRPRAVAVWVLGASLGGPQAVRAFLAALDGKPPSVGLVLAQHIGDAFVPLLAEQLQRMTGIPVAVAREGSPILTGQVTLVPVDRRFTLTDQGLIALTGEVIPGTYRPCIDDVMEQVVGYYKHSTCAVVFSGMGDDGSRGAGAIVRAGGTVFAQSADTCVISSMPDAVRRSTTVGESAAPEALARRMLDWIADRRQSDN
ncbi:protein-glutamate methylesterase [Thiohalobacter sp. COW1]|uniref:chemotaxis protein CheB n=1 Tax=Thiohalobacter sp. COW1 TaxID=2795687 RepID=UPI001915F9AF|nr:chemotaxis protein CheB [Thiohalobacter sp. COW1]BCO32695.1 protein-glutamate methylesterase [Thiohalobacter sp. COW1]